MAITASTPDAFFDAEPWAFNLTIRQPDSSGPLDLTGSRLFAKFIAFGSQALVGVCDSGAGDDSLSIASGTGGVASFFLTEIGRTWRAPRGAGIAISSPTQVTGDLFRLPPGGTEKDWKAICRLRIDVLPSTGLPS